MDDIVIVEQDTGRRFFQRGDAIVTSTEPDGRVRIKTSGPVRPENIETVYSARRTSRYYACVAHAFGERWLNADRVTDRLRTMWQQKDHVPSSHIHICRIGRDFDVLWSRNDAGQNAFLMCMVSRIKRSGGEDNGLLYELHIATLFDRDRGFAGEIAADGQEGYDVKVDLHNGKRLWVSCKRLYTSEKSKRFDKASTSLMDAMISSALSHNIRSFTGFVKVGGAMQEFDDHALRVWDDLCRVYDESQGWASRRGDRHFLAIGPYDVPGSDDIPAHFVQSRYAIYVVSDVHGKEATRINDRIKTVTKGLKAAVPSAPSWTDAFLVALEIPRDIASAAVADMIAKEFNNGNYRDLSGVLLTRSLDAADSAHRIQTMSDELYVLANPKALVDLNEFLGDGTLHVRVEGEWVDRPLSLIMRIPDADLTQPDGYINWRWVANYDGQVWISAMHTLPLVADIMLAQTTLPIDRERAVDLKVVECLR